ncbi:TPA: hypothetical protein JLL74_001642 [Escherichia coli]|uniref:hypothetical protein n=1 Tax=Escherichia coli TaxID=562 RepID=UPI0021008B06|nr:hypothetical protein [Escherichia coli]MCQ1597700.1 hypothetical protein [Escherichia coli]HBB9562606.1 hypothetical protein [Escherichia coli]
MKEDYSIRKLTFTLAQGLLSPRAWGKDVQKGCVKQSRKRLLSLLELRRILFFYRK